MDTVTKKELTDRIADSLDEKRVLVKDIIQRFLDEMVEELSKGNRLEFRDFGVFEVRLRKPRMAQNPRTLQRVPVPVKCTVKFKVGRLMKDNVQKAAAPLRAAKAERAAPAAASQPVPPPA
jgi:integration host factor subunit beta